MEIRVVPAGRGWNWIVDGFRLFRREPLAWMLLVATVAGLLIASMILQPVGTLVGSLLSPVLLAGLMNACRAAERGEEPEISHLFSAFPTHAVPLVTIGGVHLVGNIIAVGVVYMVAGSDAVNAVISSARGDPTALAAVRGLLFGMAVGTVVFIPVIMAVWFAPLLVLFHGMKPVTAMWWSFTACWRNTSSFLVYGVASLLLWLIASIPLMLGLAVLLPVLACSIYTSFTDIFGALPEPAGSSEEPETPA